MVPKNKELPVWLESTDQTTFSLSMWLWKARKSLLISKLLKVLTWPLPPIPMPGKQRNRSFCGWIRFGGHMPLSLIEHSWSSITSVSTRLSKSLKSLRSSRQTSFSFHLEWHGLVNHVMYWSTSHSKMAFEAAGKDLWLSGLQNQVIHSLLSLIDRWFRTSKAIKDRVYWVDWEYSSWSWISRRNLHESDPQRTWRPPS